MRDDFLRMLYEKHFETIFEYCLPKLGFDKDAAADCAHAVFDEAGKKYEKLRDHPNLLGWLMVTAKHKLHKAWRKNTRDTAKLIPIELAAAIPDPGDPFGAVELTDADIARITEAVLSGLGEGELEIYRLFYVEKLSFRETGERLGISEKAARARLARVKAKLKNRLAEYI
ncbi:MAG: sigma-70 family RNA polymerase sigma factor [Clostridia bacterium]|nr:sigma-70 family RNA polymerase sigma factor [Clostridia bacterium]